MPLVLAAIIRYARSMDELQRRIIGQSLAVAGIVTVMASVSCGTAFSHIRRRGGHSSFSWRAGLLPHSS
jgi:hypothetical protein